MKLITTSNELQKQFKRLTKKYSNFYWATAWASAGSSIFKELVSHKDKIKKLVVGIHFYQTHPDFISEFLDNKNVHFVQQPDGTFHPKIYLFTNNERDWEVIIGSANFTTAAFTKNTEASILLGAKECSENDMYQDCLNLIIDSFSKGKVFSKSDLDKYMVSWNIHAPKIRSISGNYGDNKMTTPAMTVSPLMTMSWETFIDKVRNDQAHSVEDRLAVLRKANELFSKEVSFKDLELNEQKFIAGIPNDLAREENIDCGYFGSMQSAVKLKGRIKDRDINISNALDQIPLTGTITQKHYENYILHFSKVFDNAVAVSSRLLCMKRPDIFICLDGANINKICNSLGIKSSSMNYEKYWNLIILRILDCEWWNNPSYSNSIEEGVSNARAAFVDSLFYDPENKTKNILYK